MSPKPSKVEDRRVGEWIRAHRLARRISQPALAAHLGVTFQQVQKYEKGTDRISISSLHRVAAFLDVDLATLTGPVEAPGSPELHFASRNRKTAELMQLWDELPVAAQTAILTLARAAARRDPVG